MIKKLILSLGIFTTLSFGATIQDAINAANNGNQKKAISIFENLASKGDAEAQYALGLIYADGEGVKQDYIKAKEWYTKSANQKHAQAQHNVGVMYANGYGAKQDYKIAKIYFGQACDGGHQLGCDAYKEVNQLGY